MRAYDAGGRPAHTPSFLHVDFTGPKIGQPVFVVGNPGSTYRDLTVAQLLEIRDVTGVVPTIYFEWTEGNPISNMLRFLVTGGGEVAPVTREVLRESERDVKRRPLVHVS